MATLTIRVDLTAMTAIGPGKIRLLELIEAEGSISAAAREMEMSYRRAWLLVDELNHLFRQKLVAASAGGGAQGGARLTAFGHALIERYRRLEHAAHKAAAPHLKVLDAATNKRRPTKPERRAITKRHG